MMRCFSSGLTSVYVWSNFVLPVTVTSSFGAPRRMMYSASIGDCIAKSLTVPIMSRNRLCKCLYCLTLLSLMRPLTIMTGTWILRAVRRKFGQSSVSTGRKTRGRMRRSTWPASHGRSSGK